MLEQHLLYKTIKVYHNTPFLTVYVPFARYNLTGVTLLPTSPLYSMFEFQLFVHCYCSGYTSILSDGTGFFCFRLHLFLEGSGRLHLIMESVAQCSAYLAITRFIGLTNIVQSGGGENKNHESKIVWRMLYSSLTSARCL